VKAKLTVANSFSENEKVVPTGGRRRLKAAHLRLAQHQSALGTGDP